MPKQTKKTCEKKGGSWRDNECQDLPKKKIKRKSAILHIYLERPVLLDLNDPIPLTLAVKNVLPKDIKEIKSSAAKCILSANTGNLAKFNIFHTC